MPTSCWQAQAAPPATTGLGAPIDSAQRLYDAWKADDRFTAGTVAEANAVEGMWATAPGDYAQYSGCDSAEFDTSMVAPEGVRAKPSGRLPTW